MKNSLWKILASLMALSVCLLSPLDASAQAEDDDYRFDIGGGVGMTGYLGDANSANLFAQPGFSGELLFRYILNPRWAFRTNFYAGSLRGDSSKMDNVFPQEAAFKFSAGFYELGEMVEFNFFNYGLGKKYQQLSRITPYIAAGFSFNLFSVDGKNNFTVSIPLGIGVKYKPRKRLNLGLEFTMKKTFSDKIDGEALQDPYMIKHSFIKNTDWYSTLTFTISYEFGLRCAECNYKQ